MIDLRQMRQFVAVAEEMHFHRAAARLNMSQPPLTAAVRKLEEEIGAELIERGNRIVQLTAAGEAFLEEARLTLKQADRALAATRAAAQGGGGEVRLTYVGSALYGRMPDLIRRFRQENPGVRLDLREATSSSQIEAVRRRQTDVAVIHEPAADAQGLSIRSFDVDRLAIALPREHKLIVRPTFDIVDLADQPFVLWPGSEGRGFHLQVIKVCTEAGFVPRVVQEAHGMHAVLSLVAVGAGVSIVPASMSSFRSAEISYRTIMDDAARFKLALCWASPLAPAAERFLKMASSGDSSDGS